MFCHLGYNAVQSAESQSTFVRNMSPPSSGLVYDTPLELEVFYGADTALL
jgi:hypothetical protein